MVFWSCSFCCCSLCLHIQWLSRLSLLLVNTTRHIHTDYIIAEFQFVTKSKARRKTEIARVRAFAFKRTPWHLGQTGYFFRCDESISNALSLLKLRQLAPLLHVKEIFLFIAVCSCCALDHWTKLRSYTVRTDFWSMLEFWKDYILTSHFNEQVDKTTPNQLCCGIQRTVDCKTHHRGKEKMGRDGMS